MDIGEGSRRFLPLKEAQDEGAPPVKTGDVLVVMLNAQDLIVDFHSIDVVSSHHQIIRGHIAQNLPVGHERVVIKSGGRERSFSMRPQARHKVAAIPIGSEALFPTDETEQIADATVTASRTANEAGQQPAQMPLMKSAHVQVQGTIWSP